MSKKFTVLEFFKRFPDDDACLDHLMGVRYGTRGPCPKCGKVTNFSRIKKEPAYQCQWCSHHIHPMAGTPFARSRTPLQKWFYAMYLFTTSRHGVPAKELQRQLGVTYKTAWRMGHEIRKYMGDVDGDSGSFGPHVELDETYMGGYKAGAVGGKGKPVVFGIHERKGHVQTYVVPNRRRKILEPYITKHVRPGTVVSTDEAVCYQYLGTKGYKHTAVCHEAGEYVKGIHHTNSLEGFWSRLKASIVGTHVHVSKKHLHKYLGEFEYRYNMRTSPSRMFDRLLVSF